MNPINIPDDFKPSNRRIEYCDNNALFCVLILFIFLFTINLILLIAILALQ